MSDHPNIDNERGWTLIDQFAAGDLPETERVWMARWVAQTPAAAMVVHTLRNARVVHDIDAIAFDDAQMRERVLSQDTLRRPQVFSASHGSERAASRERSSLKKQIWGGRILGLRNQTLRTVRWIGATVAVIGGVFVLARRAPESSSDVTRVYATNASQQAIVNLDDGTRVTLAPGTTLRLWHFGAQSRTVTLEAGEAYFEVAHASGVPFAVRSGEATATVLGTAFLVRHVAGGSHVHVAVAEGKVHVTPPARTGSEAAGVTLTRGQVGDLVDSTTHVTTNDDLASGTEWVSGYIIFRDTPLTTVLRTVSQWYGYHFCYADSTLGAQSVTLTVSTRSSAEALAAIERVLEVNLTVVGDTVTLVPKPPKTGRSAPRIRTYDVWTPTREVGR